MGGDEGIEQSPSSLLLAFCFFSFFFSSIFHFCKSSSSFVSFSLFSLFLFCCTRVHERRFVGSLRRSLASVVRSLYISLIAATSSRSRIRRRAGDLPPYAHWLSEWGDEERACSKCLGQNYVLVYGRGERTDRLDESPAFSRRCIGPSTDRTPISFSMRSATLRRTSVACASNRPSSLLFIFVFLSVSLCVCVWCRLLVSRPFHVSCLCSLRVRPFADAGQIKKVPRRSATRQLFWHSYSSPVAPFPVVVIRPQNDTWLASFLFFFFILIFIYLFTFLTPPLSSRSARAHPLSAMCDVCVHSHSRRYDFAFDSNTERNQAKLRRGFLF